LGDKMPNTPVAAPRVALLPLISNFNEYEK